jgi:co-chaperonin GroES (HSP10)
MKLEDFKPHADKVFVTELERGPQKTSAGIIIPDDNATERGLRPRWGQIVAVGKNIKDLTVGQWLLIEHGRWTNGIEVEIDNKKTKFWYIDYPAAILLVSDEKPENIDTIKL